MAGTASVRAEEAHLLCVWDDGNSTRLTADFPNRKVVMTYPSGDVETYINGHTEQDADMTDVVSGGQKKYYVEFTSVKYRFGYNEVVSFKNGFAGDLGVFWEIDRGSHVMRSSMNNHTARCDPAGPSL
jgi:hypothetical protein